MTLQHGTCPDGVVTRAAFACEFVAYALDSDVTYWVESAADRLPQGQDKQQPTFALEHILRRNPYDLGSRVLQPDLARNQTDDSADEQDPETDPDPGDQRKDVCLNDGFFVPSAEPRSSDRRLRSVAAKSRLRWRLTARLIAAALRLERLHYFAVLSRCRFWRASRRSCHSRPSKISRTFIS